MLSLRDKILNDKADK